MCNKCLNHHKELFENHHQINLEKDENDIFIDICKEINHPNKLQYFCKTHNMLCCGLCITKLEGEGNGQHRDCNICFIKNIIEEKKNKLTENIKEEIKLNIQKTFTKIRNTLNKREDELLKEVEVQYNHIYCKEDVIRESEKLPNKIKIALEKTKLINNKCNDESKISSMINYCIDIEDNIKKIESINNNIEKCKSNSDIIIEFRPKEENIDNFIQNIKSFGNLLNPNIENLDSFILKNKNDVMKFYLLISNIINISNIKLVYRASKDGLQVMNIINKINNKSNLIFIFFTGNRRIFGVFIKLENIQDSKYFKDENAYAFSLDNNKIYKILVPEKAIKFNNSGIIVVGNTGNSNGFYFSNNKTIIYDKYLLNYPKIYNFQKNLELTEGFDNFTELEIYEINSK